MIVTIQYVRTYASPGVPHVLELDDLPIFPVFYKHSDIFSLVEKGVGYHL